MSQTNYRGIDYGLGMTNVGDAGIRFGVIPHHDLLQAWADSSEADYGEPTCPKCGNEAKPCKHDYARFEHAKHECDDYVCVSCKYVFGSESAFSDEPHAFEYEEDGYKCRQSGDDCDIFILKSPYFTHAQYCSPCAPGACYLRNALEEPHPDNRCYCFGHDWFEQEKAPYRVFSVETGKEIIVEEKRVECPNCHGSGRDTLKRVAEARGVSEADLPAQVDAGADNFDDLNRDDRTFKCWRCHAEGFLTEKVEREIDPQDKPS